MRSLLLLTLLLFMGCVSQGFLKTSDGLHISYDFHKGGPRGVILLHQLGGSKEDWHELEKGLGDLGYSYIAIDLRGHGRSDGNWRYFSEDDFRSMVKDVAVAEDFLKSKGIEPYAIIGASIGANLALIYGSSHGFSRLVLLSPGFNYRGLDITGIEHPIGVLAIASKGDIYSYQTVSSMEGTADVIYVNGSGHGRDLIPEVKGNILSFLEE